MYEILYTRKGCIIWRFMYHKHHQLPVFHSHAGNIFCQVRPLLIFRENYMIFPKLIKAADRLQHVYSMNVCIAFSYNSHYRDHLHMNAVNSYTSICARVSDRNINRSFIFLSADNDAFVLLSENRPGSVWLRLQCVYFPVCITRGYYKMQVPFV